MVNLCRVTSTGILQLTHAQKKRRLVATRSITIKMKIKTHMASVVNVATKINKSRKENVKKERDSLFFYLAKLFFPRTRHIGCIRMSYTLDWTFTLRVGK